MIRGILKTGAVALMAGAALVGAANAGGFNRGSANLDGLFSDSIGMYSGVTVVSPGRSYSRVQGLVLDNGAPAVLDQSNVEFGDSFIVPYASFGGKLAQSFACVGSYSEPFGAASTYSGDITYHIAQQSLDSDELGLTCSYRYDLGKGRLSFIGGVFNEGIEYNQARNFERAFAFAGVNGDSMINVTSRAWGYRVGLAYEIPEIALKAQLMYRSQTDHDASGTYSNTPFATLAAASAYSAALGGGAVAANAAGAAAAAAYGGTYLGNGAAIGGATSTSATASASLPQSVELSVQTGVAPGWLVFGNIKWSDWSVLESVVLVEGIQGQEFSTSRFFFNDGWTVTGGVAHRFNEQLAGSASLTWDRGVTTGWDTLTDTWTVAGGVAYDVNDKVQIRAGGAAIYFTAGEKSQTASSVDYTAVSPGEWGFALSTSASIKF